MRHPCGQRRVCANPPQPLLVHSFRQRDAMLTYTLSDVQPCLLLLLAHCLGIQQGTDAPGIRDSWRFRHCFLLGEIMR